MIVYGDGGAVLLVLLLGMAATVVVPVLLVRAAARRLTSAGWEVQRYEGWPPMADPGEGWQVPEAPVLPAVDAAEVVSLRGRLAHDVRTLEPGDDPVARQALADAAERLATCTALLERARSDAQLRTAWLAAIEGLHAARVVRGRLGLDGGPPVPAPPAAGPALQQRATVDVGGRRYVGAPQYEPGSQHWFPGGSYEGRTVPRGWYDAPFWPSGMLLGGLGGLALGTMIGGGLLGGYDGDGGGGGGLDGDASGDGAGGWGAADGWGVAGGGGDWGGDAGDLGGDW